jgi:nicotinamide-nucleotide amidase
VKATEVILPRFPPQGIIGFDLAAIATDLTIALGPGGGVFPTDIKTLATATLQAARGRGLTIAAAESCTGGLVAAALTDIAGSSDVLDRGVVTYSNESKAALLGVPARMIAAEGAVSEAVARAMAEGVLAGSGADLAVAVTGVAGPGGGSAEKPVGLVWFALARRGAETLAQERQYGDIGRGQVRLAAVRTALEMLLSGAQSPEES